MINNSLIFAPWTAEQVKALNRWQSSPHVHPFTCPGLHEAEQDRILIATLDGWRCRRCDYRQNWAHPFMLNEPPINAFAPKHRRSQPSAPSERGSPMESLSTEVLEEIKSVFDGFEARAYVGESKHPLDRLATVALIFVRAMVEGEIARRRRK